MIDPLVAALHTSQDQSQNPNGLKYGIVTQVSPLLVRVGAASTATACRAVTGFKAVLGAFVAVWVQGADRLVLGAVSAPDAPTVGSWGPAPDPLLRINGDPVGYTVLQDGNRYVLSADGTVTWQCTLEITSVAGVFFPPNGGAQFTVNRFPVTPGGVAESQGIPSGMGIYGGNGTWPFIAMVYSTAMLFQSTSNPSGNLMIAGNPGQPATVPQAGDTVYWTVTYEAA